MSGRRLAVRCGQGKLDALQAIVPVRRNRSSKSAGALDRFGIAGADVSPDDRCTPDSGIVECRGEELIG